MFKGFIERKERIRRFFFEGKGRYILLFLLAAFILLGLVVPLTYGQEIQNPAQQEAVAELDVEALPECGSLTGDDFALAEATEKEAEEGSGIVCKVTDQDTGVPQACISDLFLRGTPRFIFSLGAHYRFEADAQTFNQDSVLTLCEQSVGPDHALVSKGPQLQILPSVDASGSYVLNGLFDPGLRGPYVFKRQSFGSPDFDIYVGGSQFINGVTVTIPPEVGGNGGTFLPFETSCVQERFEAGELGHLTSFYQNFEFAASSLTFTQSTLVALCELRLTAPSDLGMPVEAIPVSPEFLDVRIAKPASGSWAAAFNRPSSGGPVPTEPSIDHFWGLTGEGQWAFLGFDQEVTQEKLVVEVSSYPDGVGLQVARQNGSCNQVLADHESGWLANFPTQGMLSFAEGSFNEDILVRTCEVPRHGGLAGQVGQDMVARFLSPETGLPVLSTNPWELCATPLPGSWSQFSFYRLENEWQKYESGWFCPYTFDGLSVTVADAPAGGIFGVGGNLKEKSYLPFIQR